MTTTIADAKPDDLSGRLACDAYRWSSHLPEERGRREQQSYADDVNALRDELAPHAATDAQKAILAEEMERYRLGYLSRLSVCLVARSRCASSFITGGSNFPVRQQEKRRATEEKRTREFLEWREKARAAVKRKVLDARTDDVKEDERWQALARSIQRDLDVIRSIDEQGAYWTRSAFVNGIAGKAERLAQKGEASLVGKALEMVKAYNDAHKKPAISPRHAFWTFAEMARQKATAHDAAQDAEPATLAEGAGVRIVENRPLDRVQVLFDAKPGEEMRAKLKGEGWNWSPTEGAWQRKLTNAAIYSAKKLTGLGL